MSGEKLAEIPPNAQVTASFDPDSELFIRARRLIADRLGVEEAKVIPEADLIEDLGADSLDLVELALSFEEAFSVSLPDRDMDQLKTVRSAVEQVARLLAAQAAAA